jgi:ABC-type siderophore export system fused ATPase/permease subunit
LTIAACLLTPGGVVLGADSTTTISVVTHDGSVSPHYFEHAQKLFEVGEGSTIGAVT